LDDGTTIVLLAEDRENKEDVIVSITYLNTGYEPTAKDYSDEI
jgi:hypothetical protein